MSERVDPPLRAGEAETVLAFLDYHRATFRSKVEGVNADGLRTTLGASAMTLGGMVKHLTLVEESWFGRVLQDQPLGDPWDSVDWASDPDWEWRTGSEEDPAELFAAYDETVARSRAAVDALLLDGGLETESKRPNRASQDAGSFSLRWILLHMLEEYARHNGHADLLRESVDGAVGE